MLLLLPLSLLRLFSRSFLCLALCLRAPPAQVPESPDGGERDPEPASVDPPVVVLLLVQSLRPGRGVGVGGSLGLAQQKRSHQAGSQEEHQELQLRERMKSMWTLFFLLWYSLSWRRVRGFSSSFLLIFAVPDAVRFCHRLDLHFQLLYLASHGGFPPLFMLLRIFREEHAPQWLVVRNAVSTLLG